MSGSLRLTGMPDLPHSWVACQSVAWSALPRARVVVLVWASLSPMYATACHFHATARWGVWASPFSHVSLPRQILILFSYRLCYIWYYIWYQIWYHITIVHRCSTHCSTGNVILPNPRTWWVEYTPHQYWSANFVHPMFVFVFVFVSRIAVQHHVLCAPHLRGTYNTAPRWRDWWV